MPVTLDSYFKKVYDPQFNLSLLDDSQPKSSFVGDYISSRD